MWFFNSYVGIMLQFHKLCKQESPNREKIEFLNESVIVLNDFYMDYDPGEEWLNCIKIQLNATQKWATSSNLSLLWTPCSNSEMALCFFCSFYWMKNRADISLCERAIPPVVAFAGIMGSHVGETGPCYSGTENVVESYFLHQMLIVFRDMSSLRVLSVSGFSWRALFANLHGIWCEARFWMHKAHVRRNRIQKMQKQNLLL